MQKLLSGLLVLFIVATTAHARLGESEAEIEARLGKGEPARILNGADKVLIYKLGIYAAQISFSDGKSVSENYIKPSAFSDSEIEVFLEANHGGGSTWKAESIGSVKLWTRSDGAAHAVWQKREGGNLFTVSTSSYIDRRKALSSQQKPQTAHPHLGQSETEVEAACGKPLIQPKEGADSKLVLYSSSALRVGITYSNGKALSIMYGKQNHEDFTIKELNALLAANSPEGVSWKIAESTTEGAISWMRSDKAAAARYRVGTSGPSLLVVDLKLSGASPSGSAHGNETSKGF